MALAAKGDRDALALLRDSLMDDTTSEPSNDLAATMWAQVEVYARLAAQHGIPSDLVTLGMVLLVRSRILQASGHEALATSLERHSTGCFSYAIASNDVDAIALLTAHVELQADNGDHSATPYLEQIVETLPRDLAIKVKAKAREKRLELAK